MFQKLLKNNKRQLDNKSIIKVESMSSCYTWVFCSFGLGRSISGNRAPGGHGSMELEEQKICEFVKMYLEIKSVLSKKVG
jgi:hypothetical protein